MPDVTVPTNIQVCPKTLQTFMNLLRFNPSRTSLFFHSNRAPTFHEWHEAGCSINHKTVRGVFLVHFLQKLFPARPFNIMIKYSSKF